MKYYYHPEAPNSELGLLSLVPEIRDRQVLGSIGNQQGLASSSNSKRFKLF